MIVFMIISKFRECRKQVLSHMKTSQYTQNIQFNSTYEYRLNLILFSGVIRGHLIILHEILLFFLSFLDIKIMIGFNVGYPKVYKFIDTQKID